MLARMKTSSSFPMHRRTFLGSLGAATGLAILKTSAPPARAEPSKGRIKQCVCSGYSGLKLDMDGMCREAARLGAYGVDLVGPRNFRAQRNTG